MTGGRYLFTTLPTNDLGLITRSLPIAAELTRRGHEVVFSSPAQSPRRVIAAAGFRNEPPRHALFELIDADHSARGLWDYLRSDGPRRHGHGRVAFLRELLPALPKSRAPATADVHDTDHAAAMMGGMAEGFVRANVEAFRRLIEHVRPDAVVDFWHPYAVVAARSLGVPVATVVQADAHPASDGFRWWRPRPTDLPDPVPVLNRVAATYGLEPVSSLSDYCVGDVTLVTGTPETDPLPAGTKVTYVGALLWERPGEQLPAGVAGLPHDRPRVWVYSGNPAYGSGGAALDSAVVLESCVAALAGGDLEVVLTTGHHDLPAHLRPLPAGLHHEPWVPGLQMATASDLLIHHGGYGSCQTGLVTGTPAVVLPTFSERESNARRLATLGAGELVPVTTTGARKEVDVGVLRRTVDEVLRSPSYAANARRLGDDLRALGGPETAADRIEPLAGTATTGG